jgi:S-phase kinase-associated protein 1
MALSMTTNDILIIQSADNHSFPISKEAACKSVVINDMIESLGDSSEPIPLTNSCCTYDNLQKVLIFLDYIHNNQEEATKLNEWVDSKGNIGNQPDWFKNFINVDKQILFQIILIADYLDIQILVDFACFTVANQIKSMSPEEIQQVFSVDN